jgi:hypothetical protein
VASSGGKAARVIAEIQSLCTQVECVAAIRIVSEGVPAVGDGGCDAVVEPAAAARAPWCAAAEDGAASCQLQNKPLPGYVAGRLSRVEGVRVRGRKSQVAPWTFSSPPFLSRSLSERGAGSSKLHLTSSGSAYSRVCGAAFSPHSFARETKTRIFGRPRFATPPSSTSQGARPAIKGTRIA